MFKKIVNGFKPFIVFTKSSILDVWLSSEYTSVSIREVSVYRLEGYRKKTKAVLQDLIVAVFII